MIGETRTAQGNQNSENLNIPRSHGLSVSLNQLLSYHIYIHVIISLVIFNDSSSKCELYLLTDSLLVRRKAHYLVEKGKKQQQKQNKKN